MTFQERVEQGTVLFDGAMGTQIQALNPSESDYDGKLGCSEILNITRPEAIQAIHENYFKAGCDVVETNSFGSNEIVLADYGLADRARDLSRISAGIARNAAEKYQHLKPRFVAGSMGPGTKLISLGQTDWETMHHSYSQQAAGLLEGGVDLLVIETSQDPLQIKCAIIAAQDQMSALGVRVPLIVTVTVETTGTLLVGSELGAVITALEPFDLFALGINCATGPDDMKPYVRQLSEMSNKLILIQPNAGFPQNIHGQMVYSLSSSDFTATLKGFVDQDGVDIVGGCCGTTPEFTKTIHKTLQGVTKKTRQHKFEPSIASLFSSQTLRQDPAPFFIGERTNTNGSKKFRDALLKDDWDQLVEIARDQAGTGIHGLDLCVAYTGRNEAEDMKEVMSRMATQITLPLFIDSTDTAVIETALRMYGGRAVINSINLEDGEARADKICALAKRYGAALIALTIDETGMARSVEKKVEVAKRIYEIVVTKHNLRPQDLLFDPLTFTLASGDETLKDSAATTMEAIGRIKAELPGVYTVLGLSNVSFGLKPASRKILNSVFLHDCVEKGLDAAIVNLKHIYPLSRIPDEDIELSRNLIYNRGEKNPLFTFIEHFDSKGESEKAEAEENAWDSLPLEERIKKKIIQGAKSQLQDYLTEALKSYPATEIINRLLVPAMKVVGELFGQGKMQLPFVLQSAEVMKYAVDKLKPFMDKVDTQQQTSIVLATVRGDVHDIGKNLVDIILSNNGYKVYNLGIKAEIDTILHKALEVKADAIGMSGLLVKSTMIMKENLEEMKRRNLNIPVLLGGAALTPNYVWETCSKAASGPVVYCADAFDGLQMMNEIKEGSLVQYLEKQERQRQSPKPQAVQTVIRNKAETGPVNRDISVPKPPFLGVKVVNRVDLKNVYAFITEEVLFRGRWGYRRGKLSKEEYNTLIKNEVSPEFEALKRKAAGQELLQPAVAYAYFECNADGQELIIYEPGTEKEKVRFSFPRQKEPPHLCVADYFFPRESGKKDLIALQVATMGQSAMAECQRLYNQDSYKEYLLFHGLSVESAEALAEYQHLQIREELGIAGQDGDNIQDFVAQKYRGSRYSFGYPACPDLKQNRILCELVEAQRIGVSINESDQMVPEQTTSAFIAHHPQAKYFRV